MQYEIHLLILKHGIHLWAHPSANELYYKVKYLGDSEIMLCN